MKADCFYIHVYCVLRECHLIYSCARYLYDECIIICTHAVVLVKEQMILVTTFEPGQ